MRVLLVDDEPAIRRMLKLLLAGKGHRVAEAGDAAEALAALAQEAPEVILLDLQLPGRSGLEVLPELLAAAPAAKIVMMTAHGSIASAVEAMRTGAWDYLTKPFDNDELLARLGRIEEVSRLSHEVATLRAELESRYGLDELVGSSPRMAHVFATIRKVGPLDATVLIQGESGTGKELVARAIHRISPRSRGPFVAVNCGAIPPTLMEDTVFGHVRGAFTDARADRAGLLEQAAGGTLFLDEVGDLPLESQASLLRVLQERTFTRIGGERLLKADFRLIGATNTDLEEAVAERRFREDLYWRLNVITIRVPPLRERPEDLPALVDHLVAKRAAELGVPARAVLPEALEVLHRYPWPGNVRELENTLYRALVMAEGDCIGVGDLPARLRGPSPASQVPAAADLPLEELVAGMVERLEASVIRDRLREHGWNRTRTADSLGISRKTLFNKIQRYGIGGGEEVRRSRPPTR
jgi:two-component system, NtrC family, response regulator AtoC